MRQRYLRLISVLLLLAILTACGTDRRALRAARWREL